MVESVNSREYFSVGYINYEATLPFLGVVSRHQGFDIPSVRFLFYDSARKFEHSCDKDALGEADHAGHHDLTKQGEDSFASGEITRSWLKVIIRSWRMVSRI